MPKPTQKKPAALTSLLADVIVATTRQRVAETLFTHQRVLGNDWRVADCWGIADDFLKDPATRAHLAHYAVIERQLWDQLPRFVEEQVLAEHLKRKKTRVPKAPKGRKVKPFAFAIPGK